MEERLNKIEINMNNMQKDVSTLITILTIIKENQKENVSKSDINDFKNEILNAIK